jgi:HSP20 family protein
MLMRFDPFRELDRLTHWPAPATAFMPIDAYRQGDHFFVHFDLPGVDPSSIELTVEKNVLNVTAERNWRRTGDEQLVVNERPQGTFSRQLFLGETLDTSNIEASYDQGVLTVTISVAEAAKPRKVQIAVGESQAKAIHAEATTSP